MALIKISIEFDDKVESMDEVLAGLRPKEQVTLDWKVQLSGVDTDAADLNKADADFEADINAGALDPGTEDTVAGPDAEVALVDAAEKRSSAGVAPPAPQPTRTPARSPREGTEVPK